MILPGHGDLKPVPILGFSQDGKAFVMVGDKVKKYDLFVSPSGAVHVKPPDPVPVDQVGEGENEHKSLRERWAASGVDQ